MADCSQASNKKQGKKGPKRASSPSSIAGTHYTATSTGDIFQKLKKGVVLKYPVCNVGG